jgi:hypothetical protein
MKTKYNPLTHSYETVDGTTVADEVCDSDALLAATIREQQRLVKEALAQPEQEPVAQPEQEPVAFQNKSLYSELISAEDWENIDPVWYWMFRPLYTSPPKENTWVGLTEEEYQQIQRDCFQADQWHGIEAKLKEKNT